MSEPPKHLLGGEFPDVKCGRLETQPLLGLSNSDTSHKPGSPASSYQKTESDGVLLVQRYFFLK